MIARWLLLFVLCVAIPAAFAADVKISALPAAGGASDADELPANQSGTTRKVTAAQLATLSITNVYGASGTAGPRETWQTLNDNCAGNKTTTLATCVTTNGLVDGTYRFEYTVVWQSNTTTTGITFMVGTPAGADTFVATWIFPGTGTSAITGSNDQVTGAVDGQLAGHQSVRTNAGALGPVAGVDTANANILALIYGVIRITSPTATLYLSAAAETTGGITVASGTTLNLRRIL